jgi:hypothetical protein
MLKVIVQIAVHFRISYSNITYVDTSVALRFFRVNNIGNLNQLAEKKAFKTKKFGLFHTSCMDLEVCKFFS